MPDDNPPVSQGGTQGRRPLNVNEANVNSVKVTRMDVNTGEIKELQTDLLKEICDCIADSSKNQTTSLRQEIQATKTVLKQTLQANRKEIVDAIRKGGSGGSGGSGGGVDPSLSAAMQKEVKEVESELKQLIETMKVSMIRATTELGDKGGSIPGQDIADIKAQQRAYKILNKALKDNRIAFDKWGKLFTDGTGIQFEQNIAELNQTVFRLSQSMTDLWSTMRDLKHETKNVWEQMDTLAKTGLANLDDFFDDVFAGRLGLIETFNLIRKSSEKGLVGPLGVVGSNIQEVAENLEKFEVDIEDLGFNFSSAFRNLEEMRNAQVELLETQKRMSNLAEIGNIETSRNVSEQLKRLHEISGFTGKTVDELIEMGREDRKSFGELAAAGLITEKQAQTLADRITFLNSKGLGPLADILKDAAQFGVENGAILLAGQNEEFALQFSRYLPEIQKMLELGAEGTVDQAHFLEQVQGLLKDFRPVGAGMGGGEATIGGYRTAAGVAAAVNAMPTKLAEVQQANIDRQAGFFGELDETITDVIGWFQKNLPDSISGLVGAIAANVIALGLNTWALLRNGGRISDLLGGKGGKTGAPTKTPGKTGRLSGLAKNAGRGLGLLGRGTILGATALTAFELARATGLDDAINEAGVTGSGTIGTYLSDLFGSDATTDEQRAKTEAEVKRLQEAARMRKQQSTAVTPKTNVRPPTPTAANSPALSNMSQQLEKLTAIEAILLTANDIGTQIRDTIGAAGAMSRVGDVTGPSPVQRRVPSLKGNIQAFESALDVSP